MTILFRYQRHSRHHPLQYCFVTLLWRFYILWKYEIGSLSLHKRIGHNFVYLVIIQSIVILEEVYNVLYSRLPTNYNNLVDRPLFNSDREFSNEKLVSTYILFYSINIDFATRILTFNINEWYKDWQRYLTPVFTNITAVSKCAQAHVALKTNS